MLFHLNVLMKLVKLWLTHLMFVCIVMAAQALYYWGSRECEKRTCQGIFQLHRYGIAFIEMFYLKHHAVYIDRVHNLDFVLLTKK